MLGSFFPRIRGQVQAIAQDRLDRVGVLLSCLCLVHCLLGLVLVAALGVGATFLLDPAIHKVGLLLATLVAGAAIGIGAVRHRRPWPFLVAVTGLSFMAGAVAVGHGLEEAVLTVIGVVLVAAGHILNLRKA
ncbi:MAG: MerC domain-containing protein [Alteraurantiacibacter sp.]|nr:MerC domain-containing protein [Alteraurantiacibacter sp.]